MKIIIIPKGKTLFFSAGNYKFKGPRVLHEWEFSQKRIPETFDDGSLIEVMEIEDTPDALKRAIAESRGEKPVVKEPEVMEEAVEEIVEEVVETTPPPHDSFDRSFVYFETEDDVVEEPLEEE